MENPEYEIIRRRTCKTLTERALYERLLKSGLKLHKIHPGVHGMTSKIQIEGQPINLKNGIKQMGNTIEISGLFDGGADSAFHIKQLGDSVELEDLDETYGIMTTAHGTVNKVFNRKKIKLIGSYDICPSHDKNRSTSDRKREKAHKGIY